MGNPDSCVEQTQIIINLRYRTDGGTRVMARCFLVNGDGRRKPLDEVYIRLFHLPQKLPVTNGDNGEETLIERTTDERPFIFISGMGVTLPAFEEKVVNLAKGEEFDFQLDPEQAYGQHYDERVLELDKQIFTINGQFDAQHVQVGAIIPLQNEDGNHFNAVVKNISDTKVTCDLNHPLAGLKLNFCGQILESREATAEEIAKMAQMISGEGGGCSGGCDNCGGDCKDGNCEGGCEGGCNK